MVRELQLRFAKRTVVKLKGSMPLGGDEVAAVMLQMFGVHDEASFNRLPRACRHHIVVSAMQHTAGLRFGHFIFRNYRKCDLAWNRLGATLLTDWQRYPGRASAAIAFHFHPKWHCFRYHVDDRTTLTAAGILQ